MTVFSSESINFFHTFIILISMGEKLCNDFTMMFFLRSTGEEYPLELLKFLFTSFLRWVIGRRSLLIYALEHFLKLSLIFEL